MPRPAIELDVYRTEIERRIANKDTQGQIRRWLASRGVRISKNTLSTRVVAWEASRRTRTAASDPSLIAAVEQEFFTTHHDDQTIADAITAQGLSTTRNQVEEIRLSQGWRRRHRGNAVAEARAETFARVQAALQEGACRCYGRRFLQSYLRLNGHIAREDDVRDALAHFDPQGTEARRRGPSRRQPGGEFIVPGPDFLWSIDGHDKFRNYGIGIYAGVDVYSRRIQWIYVGNSNRRQLSILHQMVSIVEGRNRCPSFWRSDRGKEVLLLADAHYSFFRKHREAQGASPEEIDSLRFRDCYMFGTSTANIKIESTWMRMIRSQTRPWLVSSVAGGLPFPSHLCAIK